MSLFDALFGKSKKRIIDNAAKGSIFETLTAYKPAFTTWGGQMYESELIRAVVDAFARHVSKLNVQLVGSAHPTLKTELRMGANPFMSWSQFLYRLATIYEVTNNAFIVPVLDDYGNLKGYYPVLPSSCEIKEYNGKLFLCYDFSTGKRGAIELERCCILTKHQYKNDFFGERNTALDATLALLDMTQQGIKEGVKNSATFRFMARKDNFSSPKDLAKEREAFNETNLRGESGGLLLFPNTFTDIRQIESKPYVVDAKQMELIQTNVFNYFGCNEKILQSSAIGDDLDAYFNSKVEPFMIALAEGMERMTFTQREISQGNRVSVTANRLQYMSTANKIALAREMGDRGVLLIDEIRELLNYEPLPDGQGQHAPIRGEYYMLDEGKDTTSEDEENGGKE